jgi:hypothetical protein
MTLAEDPLGQVVAADWIGKFVMLGRLAARWSPTHADSQLVVVLSVPVRDFAAVLVGCGWMTAAAAPSIQPVREVLAGLPLHAPVRVVTRSHVLAERFGGVNVVKDRARFGTDWQIDKLQAVVPLESLDTPRRQPIPEPGVISRLTGIDLDWPARLCSPPQDLALVGTLKWLDDDLTAFLGRGDAREPVANILLPAGPRAATWSTRIYPASQLDVELRPSTCRRSRRRSSSRSWIDPSLMNRCRSRSLATATCEGSQCRWNMTCTGIRRPLSRCWDSRCPYESARCCGFSLRPFGGPRQERRRARFGR